ncbi:MAG TPA: PPOX class F420-dependent oxidoreductase [Pyrinomonadaceae bacterium]|nr:PPOX class F420-dependent oxidoreductase [Pyrinomonadaceae bacterium]
MNRDDALDFVSKNHRSVLVTRKAGDGLQTSPVTVGIDGDGYVVISSRETAFKVRNLRRDPRATLCVFSDTFYGKWIQIDGAADLISMPDAMERLVDYYRRISGEHPDWDEYRSAMQEQKRLIIRISIDKVGPKKEG